jgi:hypothetical protein
MTVSYDIHSDAYRPMNVRVEYRPEGSGDYYPDHRFVVLDFDGVEIGHYTSREQAERRRRQRAGVIKAALTRRANKAAGIR